MNNLLPTSYFLLNTKKDFQEKVKIYLCAFEAIQLNPYETYPDELILKRLELAMNYRDEVHLDMVSLQFKLKKEIKSIKTRKAKKEFKNSINQEIQKLKNITEPIASAIVLFNYTNKKDFIKLSARVINELKRLEFKIDASTIRNKWKRANCYNTNCNNYIKLIK